MVLLESSLSVADKVIKIVREEGDLDGFEITLESDLREDLGLDSVDTVHILFGLESEFDIEIPEEDIEKVRNVGDIVDYISSMLNGTDLKSLRNSVVEVTAS
jgi:acyl carrier protein